jgi:bifunctional DNA-binding transcriptional regulator/antitoxin component of YhaV-PrlF toxin-antitoxin module
MSEKEKTLVVEVQKDENGELYIELSDEFLEDVGWKIGDTLTWTETEDGKLILKKEEDDDTNDSGN